jgi:hypothetical protein
MDGNDQPVKQRKRRDPERARLFPADQQRRHQPRRLWKRRAQADAGLRRDNRAQAIPVEL